MQLTETEAGFRWGTTYLAPFVSLIPSALLGSKNEKDLLVWHYRPDDFVPDYLGYGYTPGAVNYVRYRFQWPSGFYGEAYMNFGIIGLVPASILFGWAIRRSELLLETPGSFAGLPCWYVGCILLAALIAGVRMGFVQHILLLGLTICSRDRATPPNLTTNHTISHHDIQRGWKPTASHATDIMKILHVIPNLQPRAGGAAAACLNLCVELASRNHDVAICTALDPKYMSAGHSSRAPKAEHVRGIKVDYFPTVRGSYGFSVKFWRALEQKIPNVNIVHIHELYRFHFVAASYLCRRYRIPYVVYHAGSLDPFLCRIRRWRKWLPERVFLRPGFANAGAIQFAAEEDMQLAALSGLFSTSEANLVRNGVIVPHGVTVPEGITIPTDLHDEAMGDSKLVTAYPELRGKKLILFLSRINFKKGLDITAKAFALVRKSRDDVHLVITGPDNEGYSKKVMAWLREEGVLDHATFTGWLREEDVLDHATFAGMLTGPAKSDAFKAASVFVLPSYTENFGLAILEVMSFGVPVVISNRVNIWREIAEADAGLVVNCDAEETAGAILRCLEDPEQAAAMGRRGRELVLRRFTWQSVADQMLALYERLIARARPTVTSTQPFS